MGRDFMTKPKSQIQITNSLKFPTCKIYPPMQYLPEEYTNLGGGQALLVQLEDLVLQVLQLLHMAAPQNLPQLDYQAIGDQLRELVDLVEYKVRGCRNITNITYFCPATQLYLVVEENTVVTKYLLTRREVLLISRTPETRSVLRRKRLEMWFTCWILTLPPRQYSPAASFGWGRACQGSINETKSEKTCPNHHIAVKMGQFASI